MSKARQSRRVAGPSPAMRLALVSTVSALALVASAAQSRTLPTGGLEIDLSTSGQLLAGPLLPEGGTEVDLRAAGAVEMSLAPATTAETTMRDVAPPQEPDRRSQLRLAALHVPASAADVDAELAVLLDRAKSLSAEIERITPTATVVPELPELAAAAAWKVAGDGSANDGHPWLKALARDAAAKAPAADADADVDVVNDRQVAVGIAVDVTRNREARADSAIARTDVADAKVKETAKAAVRSEEIASVDAGMIRIDPVDRKVPAMVRRPQTVTADVRPATVRQGEVASERQAAYIAAEPAKPRQQAKATPAPAPKAIEVSPMLTADTAPITVEPKARKTAAAADDNGERVHVKNLPWLKKRAATPDQTAAAPNPTLAVANSVVGKAAAPATSKPLTPNPATPKLAAKSKVGTTGAVAANSAKTSVAARQTPAEPQSEAMAELTVAAVSDGELAEMRAGFMVNGYEIKFGIQAATYVNGNPVPVSSFQFTSDDLENSQAAQTTGSGITFHGATPQHIIQVGPGNQPIAGALNFAGPITVIQNTLNGALIQHVAAITIDVSGFNITKANLGGLSPYVLSLGVNN